MNVRDPLLDVLLELGNPAVRRTRAEHLEHALRVALGLTDGDAAAILVPGSRRSARLVLHAGSPTIASLPATAGESELLGVFRERAEPIALADLAADPRLVATEACPGVEAGPVLFVVLRQRELMPGSLAVYRRRGRARFSATDIRSMVMLAASLASALEIQRLSSGAEKMALTDDLTEVYNARFIKTALKREVRRAGRHGQELSLLLIEADRFDAWCTQHGELRGSVAMREFAKLLAQQVRSFDLMARAGDARFIVVLPQTSRSGALEVAERMRAAVERQSIADATPGAFTVSIGLSSFPQEGTDDVALVRTAERALARAWEQGRNRVESLLDRAA
jgi:diguanylate cyclase (GGDEF)-like protein